MIIPHTRNSSRSTFSKVLEFFIFLLVGPSQVFHISTNLILPMIVMFFSPSPQPPHPPLNFLINNNTTKKNHKNYKNLTFFRTCAKKITRTTTFNKSRKVQVSHLIELTWEFCIKILIRAEWLMKAYFSNFHDLLKFFFYFVM